MLGQHVTTLSQALATLPQATSTSPQALRWPQWLEPDISSFTRIHGLHRGIPWRGPGEATKFSPWAPNCWSWRHQRSATLNMVCFFLKVAMLTETPHKAHLRFASSRLGWTPDKALFIDRVLRQKKLKLSHPYLWKIYKLTNTICRRSIIANAQCHYIFKKY